MTILFLTILKHQKQELNHFVFYTRWTYIHSCIWYKPIKDLCKQHNLDFKNQNFVEFINQMRDNFIKAQSDGEKIADLDRKNII